MSLLLIQEKKNTNSFPFLIFMHAQMQARPQHACQRGVINYSPLGTCVPTCTHTHMRLYVFCFLFLCSFHSVSMLVLYTHLFVRLLARLPVRQFALSLALPLSINHESGAHSTNTRAHAHTSSSSGSNVTHEKFHRRFCPFTLPHHHRSGSSSRSTRRGATVIMFVAEAALPSNAFIPVIVYCLHGSTIWSIPNHGSRLPKSLTKHSIRSFNRCV